MKTLNNTKQIKSDRHAKMPTNDTRNHNTLPTVVVSCAPDVTAKLSVKTSGEK